VTLPGRSKQRVIITRRVELVRGGLEGSLSKGKKGSPSSFDNNSAKDLENEASAESRTHNYRGPRSSPANVVEKEERMGKLQSRSGGRKLPRGRRGGKKLNRKRTQILRALNAPDAKNEPERLQSKKKPLHKSVRRIKGGGFREN